MFGAHATAVFKFCLHLTYQAQAELLPQAAAYAW